MNFRPASSPAACIRAPRSSGAASALSTYTGRPAPPGRHLARAPSKHRPSTSTSCIRLLTWLELHRPALWPSSSAGESSLARLKLARHCAPAKPSRAKLTATANCCCSQAPMSAQVQRSPVSHFRPALSSMHSHLVGQLHHWPASLSSLAAAKVSNAGSSSQRSSVIGQQDGKLCAVVPPSRFNKLADSERSSLQAR